MRALLGLPGQEPVVCDLPILPDKSARVEWHEDEGGGECGNMTQLDWIAVIGLTVLIFGGLFWGTVTAWIWWRLHA